MIYMKYCTIMAAIPLLLLGFAATMTTNHAVYACDYVCGVGLGFHHWWGFYHWNWHWGTGFYHWHSPCCSTYEGSCCNSGLDSYGPSTPVVGACSTCVGDQPNTQTYQSNQQQQTINNYVTVNGDENSVDINNHQGQTQSSDQGGPNFQQPPSCCSGGSNWNNYGPGDGEDP
jgi:hypothetical protein